MRAGVLRSHLICNPLRTVQQRRLAAALFPRCVCTPSVASVAVAYVLRHFGFNPCRFAIILALHTAVLRPRRMTAGAPFLFFATLVAVAVMVAATIHTDAGKGHAHMAPLFADDPEADPEGEDECQNLAGLPLPAVDARAGGDGAELLDALLAKGGKQVDDGGAA